MKDLYKAKADIERAIELKNIEKIFKSEPNLLKMLNLHNAGEIYVEHAHIVQNMIKEKKEKDFNAIKGYL